MWPEVNITCSSRPSFAWRSAIDGDLVWWECLAGDAIFAPRWHRVKVHPNGCWFLQMAACCRAGHINLSGGGRRVMAHRHAYELTHGPIPAGKVVRHSCDDPACIYPGHLLVGTQGQNVDDCLVRERRNAFGRQKLQWTDAADVRARFAAGQTQKAIARDYGVSKGCIHAVVRGKTHTRTLQIAPSFRPRTSGASTGGAR